MLEGDFDEDFKDFIFDQLRVDFVRNKEYTVLPFTRKYINEFKRLIYFYIRDWTRTAFSCPGPFFTILIIPSYLAILKINALS